MKRKDNQLLFLFYLTTLFLIATMAFSRLIREPYPTINMPSFTKSGIQDNIVPSTEFEAIVYHKGEIVWEGDFREIISDVHSNYYAYNVNFFAFNERGRSSAEGNKLREKLFSYLPGGNKLYGLLKESVKNNPKVDVDVALSNILCQKMHIIKSNFDHIQIIQFTAYYHITDGLRDRVKIKTKDFNLSYQCEE